MYADGFYGCCKATIINSFGGGEENNDESDELSYVRGQYRKRTDAENIQAQYDQLHEYLTGFKRRRTAHLVFAATCSNQPIAEQMLRDFGFYTHNEEQQTSGDRTITGWLLPVAAFNPDIPVTYNADV